MKRGEERKKDKRQEEHSKGMNAGVFVCVMVCLYIECVRLTMCVWVAVEALTWRSAAEVWVA